MLSNTTKEWWDDEISDASEWPYFNQFRKKSQGKLCFQHHPKSESKLFGHFSRKSFTKDSSVPLNKYPLTVFVTLQGL